MMKAALSTLFAAVLLLGCNGSKDYTALGVAGTAATLTVIQMARSKDPNLYTGERDCSVICRACEVPCGNECMPYGTLCYSPPGRACWESKRTDVPRPEEPAHCDPAPVIYLEKS